MGGKKSYGSSLCNHQAQKPKANVGSKENKSLGFLAGGTNGLYNRIFMGIY